MIPQTGKTGARAFRTWPFWAVCLGKAISLILSMFNILRDYLKVTQLFSDQSRTRLNLCSPGSVASISHFPAAYFFLGGLGKRGVEIVIALLLRTNVASLHWNAVLHWAKSQVTQWNTQSLETLIKLQSLYTSTNIVRENNSTPLTFLQIGLVESILFAFTDICFSVNYPTWLFFPFIIYCYIAIRINTSNSFLWYYFQVYDELIK